MNNYYTPINNQCPKLIYNNYTLERPSKYYPVLVDVVTYAIPPMRSKQWEGDVFIVYINKLYINKLMSCILFPLTFELLLAAQFH